MRPEESNKAGKRAGRHVLQRRLRTLGLSGLEKRRLREEMKRERC